ncbi:MAG: hypothetical protein M3391_07165 [Actinomycetota bacterium]|nr:hypothetical protein [Actinomycetota bacterium]
MSRTKSGIAALVAGSLLSLGAAVPASAHPHHPTQVGGAAGLVAAVVQVNDTLNNLTLLSNIGSIEVITVKDSLNNVLNNSPILSNNVVTLQDFLNNCTVLSCIEITDFLNDNNIMISDVVAIDVLSGGDIVIFQR